ncbi:tetratricopeptide repeat protein [Flavobacterium sp. IMCC34852]|uniref:Tetratricopeptide repeat protein n=1 Tax=Flavobacterium rivulicola TaxID=2732161 RepID=A0A7Y3R773_9FLAO|nr:tetratricopeptide repeat protein [Flavobacterium sp. IMCC34852]NNT71142.1 tetratricopeptide repeat protein [Flavobacterium sp. IMCC34852]
MKKIVLYSLLLISFLAKAQKKEKDSNLPKGNEAFLEKKYADAEAEYRVSTSKYPKKAIAPYNLGNAVYRQNHNEEAKYHYAKALKNAKTKTEKHLAYHNIGNTLMKNKDYSGAVQAYENALRNNPADEQTRYNYALAKKFLKDNPPKKDDDKSKDKKNQKEDEKKNKDKDKKDDKNKDQNQDQKGQNDKDKKDGKDKNQGKPQPQPGGVSKQRLQNLLDAVNNEEKKVQDKVNKQKVHANPKKTEKDW